MKIVVTGNAGMIGTVLCNYLLEQNYEVIGIDDLSGGFLRNVNKNVKFFVCDVCNTEIVNNIFKSEKPDFVIHCAAYAAEVLSPFIRHYNYTNNLIGSINIINACINCNVKKIINFSSMATYGEGNPPFKETDQRSPKDPYGIAKLAVEMDLHEAFEHFDLNYCSVLPHNVISPYQNYYDRYRNAIAIWTRQCILGKDITIFGDGSQKRAFSDCKFLCPTIERLLFHCSDEFFNVGSDREVTIKEAAETVLAVGNQFGFNKSNLIHLPPRKEVKFAYSDHTKAKEKLGFKDYTDLFTCIEEMFKYAITLPQSEVTTMEYEVEKKMYDCYK